MIKIGIDPDVQASGISFKYEDGKIEYNSMTISEIINHCMILAARHGIENIEIRLEAGWKNSKANFRTNINKGVDQNVAMKVGRNQGFGLAISQLLTGSGFNVKEVSPQYKFQMKVNGKWTPKGRILFAQITGIPLRSLNDDVRDAVLLVI
jgi:hypothetical protein